MRRSKVYVLFTLLMLITTACAFIAPVQPSPTSNEISENPKTEIDEVGTTSVVSLSLLTQAQPTAVATPDVREPIILPISIYILDDIEGRFSSARTAEEIEKVYEDVNEIWAQVGIIIEIQAIHRVTVPPIYLQAIATRDFRFFFQGIGGDIELSDPSLLNGFYAQDIGGPNGITPSGSRIFFVTDVPSVHTERVSSHEVGHILGLHHVLDDQGRLMFPGTNGMTLSEEEVMVARYVAQGLLDGVR